jgi:hypothetical protein
MMRRFDNTRVFVRCFLIFRLLTWILIATFRLKSLAVLDDGQVAYWGPAVEFAKDEERVLSLAGASAEI